MNNIIEKYHRSTWKPIARQEKGERISSKFGGLPFIPQGTEYPICQHCGEKMPLFLQLHKKDLPDKAKTAFAGELLQVFYCTNIECEVECEAYFPFAKSTLVRVFNSDEIDKEMSFPDNFLANIFPEKIIIDWEEKSDYPNGEELQRLMDEEVLTDLEEDEDYEYPLMGDKLLGWAAWVQGIEYPFCPECGEEMSLVFQIDSNDNLDYMFGDVGCSHVTQCKNHPHQLTIAWACG